MLSSSSPSAKLMSSMKRFNGQAVKMQSKIPPNKWPKPIERFSTPRCAMEVSYRSFHIHDHGELQQGKYEEEKEGICEGRAAFISWGGAKKLSHLAPRLIRKKSYNLSKVSKLLGGFPLLGNHLVLHRFTSLSTETHSLFHGSLTRCIFLQLRISPTAILFHRERVLGEFWISISKEEQRNHYRREQRFSKQHKNGLSLNLMLLKRGLTVLYCAWLLNKCLDSRTYRRTENGGSPGLRFSLNHSIRLRHLELLCRPQYFPS